VPNLRMPTDLLGLTPADYESTRSDDNLVAALGPACTRILTAMAKQLDEPKGHALNDEELRALLLEFDCDAFNTPLKEEGSLSKFMTRVSQVRSRVEDMLTHISSKYRKFVREIFAIVKAVEAEAAQLDIGGLHSRYSRHNPHGIVLDSMRLGIILRVNDLLAGLNYQRGIDVTGLESQAVSVQRIKNYDVYDEWASQMQRIFQSYNIPISILNDYINLSGFPSAGKGRAQAQAISIRRTESKKPKAKRQPKTNPRKA